MPKVFTVPVPTCAECPICVYAGSPYSGKERSGPQAAKDAGVAVDIDTTSHAAYCPRIKIILPTKREPSKAKPGKFNTIPTFVQPKNCPLPSAGASPTPVGPALKEKVNQARALLDDVAGLV